MKKLVIDISMVITVMKFFRQKTALIEKQIVMKVFLLLLSCFSLLGFSQQLEAPKIVSPNVASIERFGDIPVSLYSGTPNISIPIHTVSSGSINVPINLRYHSSSVRVSSQPSWVGLGWDLSPYGVITRKMEGHIDEFNLPGGVPPILPYYPNPEGPYPNKISGSERLENADWTNANTASNELYNRWLDNRVLGDGHPYWTDFHPDEFNFNFMGYSGKFFYSGPTKGWQVISDQEIKVDILGFLNSNDIYNITQEYDYLESGSGYDAFKEKIYVRAFSGFILTTPDGTKYEFGGRDAVEFTSSYGSNSLDPAAFNSSSWFLKKITDINNNEVVFNYERKLPTCNIYFTFKEITPSPNPSIVTDYQRLSGVYQWPVTLTDIETVTEKVIFNSTYSQGLRYSDVEFYNTHIDPNDKNSSTISFHLNAVQNETDNLQWPKLNNIVIRDKHNKLYKTHTFDYTENSPNTGKPQRLELKNYSIGNNVLDTKTYRFEYDNIDELPESYIGNFADHWGYYNGINYDDPQFGYNDTSREPNINSIKGLIKKVYYPTGGYTEYKWEPHYYNIVLNDSKSGIEKFNKELCGGGSRIHTIKNFSANNNLLTSKSYLYKKGYTSNITDVNQLDNSGILSGRPRYIMEETPRTMLFSIDSRPFYASFKVETFNTIDTQNNNGSGSHIGYDEVVELNTDGSYTKHFFTNFGKDYNEITHYDKLPIGSIGWAVESDAAYRNYSSLSMERGKPIATEMYNKDDILIQKFRRFYRNDNNRFNNRTRRVTTQFTKSFDQTYYNGEGQGPNDIILSTLFYNYNYTYHAIREETTTYNPDGTNPIVTNEYYEYDSYNQMKSKITTSSLGRNYKTTLNYPYDLALSEIETGTFDHYPYDEYSITVTNIYEKMVQKNMISYPIEIIKEYDNTIINSNVTEYESSGYASTNNYRILPSKSYSSKNNNNYTFAQPDIQEDLILDNSLEEKIIFHSYNNNGNPTEISKEGGSHTVYIWGYNETYPIAKIENATKSQVSLYVSSIKNLSNKDDDRTLNYLGNEGKLRESLDNLRSLSSLENALITTYTYDPLIGITSITDPRGEAVYYEYDNFNRLQFIKDAQGNLIQETQYNYKN